MRSPADSDDTPFEPSGGFIIGAALLILASVAQGIYFLLEFPSTLAGRIAASAISFLCAAIAVRLSMRLGSLVAGVLIAEIAQLALLIPQIAGTDPPYASRWLLAGAVFLHTATIVTTLLTRVRRLDDSRLLLLPGAFALLLWAAEIATPGPDPSARDWPKRVGFVLPNSVPARLNPPNGTGMTLYPSNPRNYFDDSPGVAQAILHTHPGGRATLARPAPGRYAIRGISARDSVFWLVQLSLNDFPVRQGKQYGLRFSARAWTPRVIRYSIEEAHDPWRVLGGAGFAELESGWRNFEVPFTTAVSDRNARIVFGLGDNSADVEISDVQIVDEDDQPVYYEATLSWSVSYRFNSLGCRGPERAVPKPAGSRRILALGDGWTMGEGVRESDTFTARMEAGLAERGGFDVVNCGVNGFDTAAEVDLFETTLAGYAPDIVLIGVTSDDDVERREERKDSYRPGRLARLFTTLGAVQRALHEEPRRDYAGTVAGIEKLDAMVRARGATLVVLALRDDLRDDAAWTDLIAKLGDVTARRGIPLLDIGPTVFGARPDAELRVHEVDDHPNEVAHAMIADELLRFLHERGLLRRHGPTD